MITNNITDPEGTLQGYYDTSILTDGMHELHVQVLDYAGNMTPETFYFTVEGSASTEEVGQ